jgi:ABC-type hemin transport system ATPase subunit
LLDHGSIFADGTPDTVITKEIIRKVFFASVDVSQHPRSHVPQIVMLPEDTQPN